MSSCILPQGKEFLARVLAGEADYKGGKLTRNSSIVAITLVYMKDGLTVNDELLITAIPAVPRKIVKGVTSSVSATIKLG